MKHPIFKCSALSRPVIQCLMLLMGLWYSAAALSSTEMNENSESEIKSSRCQEITAAYEKNPNTEIQGQLRQIYKDNACFKKDLNKKGNPLSDGDLGPLTKVWISRYLSSQISDDCTSSDSVDCNENKPVALSNPEEGIRPYILTEDDVTYFALNADVFDILKTQQEKSYISQPALLDEIKTQLAELEGMTDSLLNGYINQLGKIIEPVKQKSLTTEAIELLMARDKVFEAKVLISQVDKPVSSDNFNEVIENLLKSAYLSLPEELPEDPETKKSDKSDKSDKSKLKTKATNETKKILKLIDPLVKKSDLYKIKDNALDKSEFPSIDKGIIDCARNYVNIAFPGEQAIRLSLTSMLTRLKNNKPVYDFSCTVTENNSTEVTEAKEKTASKTASKEPKTEQAAYNNKALELLMREAAKPFIGSDLEPIQLKPLTLCTDCSLPMKGVSYGFYPFWQASTAYEDRGIQTVNPATVDFSVFERIAYFAIPIEHDGSIKNLLHWKKQSNVKGFVQTLKKYNVKRDVVLYSNSWQNWGQGKSEPDSDKNRKQILNDYAEQHLQQITDLHKQVKKWGGLSGITLFFDGYENTSNPANIITYVEHLNKKIADDKSINFDINLMLGIKWGPDFCSADNVIDDDKAYFQKFKQLLISAKTDNEKNPGFLKMLSDFFSSDNKASADPAISNLLVFLNEPTSRSKKCLRMQIENEFHGEDRIDVLRKVIPILARVELKESTGKKEINEIKSEFRQFSDDISYLKDNFGGMATWPMPMDKFVEEPLDEEKKSELTNPDIQQMSRFLKQGFSEPYKNYMDYARLGFMGNLLNQPVITKYFSVCSVVCPNRSLINYSFVFLLITSLVSFVSFRVNCKARKFIIKMKWFDIALKFTTVMVFLSILGCDPDWQTSADSILLSLVLYFIAYFIYQFFFCGYESQNED